MASNARTLDLALARMDWALTLMAEDEAEKKKKKEEKEKKEKAKAEAEKADGDNKDADKKEGDEAKEEDEKDDEKEDDEKKEEDKDKEEAKAKVKGQMLDDMPEWFVGPLLADLVAHEVGHTLGLRHNFKASALLTLDEINSKEVKGNKTITASVMDYSPVNFRYESGEVQGDYAMIDIGPYDFWAIEYGYTFDDKALPEILKRCVEPELQYATDEDTSGPDPLARRYDFSKDPLDYAKEQMKLVRLYRDRILDKFIKDGDSWEKARRGYELTLSLQTRSSSMMANWIGGAFVNRDKKGDPGDRPPVEVVPAEQQRAALNFVIENTFYDKAYGLTPKLLERMTIDQWMDDRGSLGVGGEATWPIHDRVLGLQSSALTWLMNPTTLRRVFDNELRLPAETDALTLPELLGTISDSAWSELDEECPADRNERKPMISSLRRDLQREHMQRLVDLVLKPSDRTAANKPISTLARMELRELKAKIAATLKRCGKKMDSYTTAHLTEVSDRIDQALKAEYTYNAQQPNVPRMFILGETTDE